MGSLHFDEGNAFPLTLRHYSSAVSRATNPQTSIPAILSSTIYTKLDAITLTEDTERTVTIEDQLKQLANEPERQKPEDTERTKKIEEKLKKKKKKPEDQQTANDD